MSEIEFRDLESIEFNGNTVETLILNNEIVWRKGELIAPIISSRSIDGSNLKFQVYNSNDVAVELYMQRGGYGEWESISTVETGNIKQVSVPISSVGIVINSANIAVNFKFVAMNKEAVTETSNNVVAVQVTKDSGVANVIAPSFVLNDGTTQFTVSASLNSGATFKSWSYNTSVLTLVNSTAFGTGALAQFAFKATSGAVSSVTIGVTSNYGICIPCGVSIGDNVCTTGNSTVTCLDAVSMAADCTNIVSMGVAPCTTTVSMGTQPCTTAVSMGGGVCTTAISSGSICTTTVSMGIGGGCGVVISSNSTGNEEETGDTMELDMEDENE